MNTVAYVYNMDPLDYRTSWIADKTAPMQVQHAPPMSLVLTFRDASNVNFFLLQGSTQNRTITFYSAEDMNEFHASITERR